MSSLALFLTLALSPGQGTPPATWTLLASPVMVEATVLGGFPETPEGMAHFDFVITVRDDHTTQCIQTFLVAVHDLPDAVRELRSAVA